MSSMLKAIEHACALHEDARFSEKTAILPSGSPKKRPSFSVIFGLATRSEHKDL